MRTLFEIINSAKDGQMPAYEECYWAMLAFSHLHYFDHSAILRLGKGTPLAIPEFQAKESLRRFKAALEISPREWVGWNNDPANPEYQKEREIGRDILKRLGFEEPGRSGE